MARTRMTKTQTKPVPNMREFLLGQDRVWLMDELLRIAQADPLVAARLQAAVGLTARAW